MTLSPLINPQSPVKRICCAILCDVVRSCVCGHLTIDVDVRDGVYALVDGRCPLSIIGWSRPDGLSFEMPERKTISSFRPTSYIILQMSIASRISRFMECAYRPISSEALTKEQFVWSHVRRPDYPPGVKSKTAVGPNKRQTVVCMDGKHEKCASTRSGATPQPREPSSAMSESDSAGSNSERWGTRW